MEALESVCLTAVVALILLFVISTGRTWIDTSTVFGIIIALGLMIVIGYGGKRFFDTFNTVTDTVILRTLSDGNEWNESDLLSHIKRERWIYRPLHMTLLGRLSTLVSNGKVVLVDGKYRSLNAPSSSSFDQSSATRQGCRIFISYRRTDSALVSGRIRDRLAGQIGADSVFMDVDSIPLGNDFRVVIEDALSQCSYLLVIIGKQWLTPRLNEETDPVRVEIEEAFRLGVPTIPILIDGATIPDADKLPQTIRDLAFRNALNVRPDPDFHADIDRLLAALDTTHTRAT